MTAKAPTTRAPGAAAAAAAAALHSAHILVSGKVQGVFYRKYTRSTAVGLELTGWVRNLPDGRVEIVAEGTRPQLAALHQWCHEGPPHAKVDSVTLVPSDNTAQAGVKKTDNGTTVAAAPAADDDTLMPVITKRSYRSFDIVK